MLLQAYLDESERDGGIFAVGGYAFAPERIESFCQEWQRMLGGISCFHMTDLWARKGEFEGFGKADVDRMLHAAVRIINDHTAAVAVVVCEREDFDAAAPKASSRRRKGRRGPYAVCCHFCMFMLATWMKTSRREGEIAYFFESGNQHHQEADRLLRAAVGSAEWAEQYHYNCHGFADKRDALPLQAADLLVWEYTKYYSEVFKQQIRQPRGSFVALMQRDSSCVFERVLAGHQVRWLYEQIPELKKI